jgi:serine/threonine-protein kinase
MLALALLVVGVLVGWLLFHNSGGGKKTTTRSPAAGHTVPAVVGLSEQQAIARLSSAGYAARVDTVKSTKARGTVLAQIPGSGARLATGQQVTIRVSRGAGAVSVPNVLGIPEKTAVAKLGSSGLRAESKPVDSTKPTGIVVSQTPAPGENVDRSSVVTLSVSKGPPRVAVPALIGKSSADAQATLKDAGLVPTIVVVPSAQPRGTVVAQKPAPGTQVPKGSHVRMNVARGGGTTTTTATTTTTTTATTTTATTTAPPPAAKVAVPSVVGLNQRAAVRKLQTAGLGARIAYVTSTNPAGQVVAQNPTPNTSVAKGSRVRLNVSVGPNPQASKTVPDVTGQDEQTATATLRQAGFTVDAFDEATTDQSQDGVVVDEEPPGGTSAPKGSVVTIYIGRLTGTTTG